MSHELILQIAVQLAVAGAIYGGIRADLQHAAKGVEEAHRRIDAMLIRARGAQS